MERTGISWDIFQCLGSLKEIIVHLRLFNLLREHTKTLEQGKRDKNTNGNNIRTDAPRAKFEKSATALSANYFNIVHASVVVLYIVSLIDSWINVRLRVYFVKVSLFVLQCICLCKDTIYYNICCDYQIGFYYWLLFLPTTHI